jgi:hypothetical protein
MLSVQLSVQFPFQSQFSSVWKERCIYTIHATSHLCLVTFGVKHGWRCSYSLVLALTLEKRGKKTVKWSKKRQSLSHVNLLELRFEPSDSSDYLRVSEKIYLELLKSVTPIIKKQDANVRSSVSPFSYYIHYTFLIKSDKRFLF